MVKASAYQQTFYEEAYQLYQDHVLEWDSERNHLGQPIYPRPVWNIDQYCILASRIERHDRYIKYEQKKNRKKQENREPPPPPPRRVAPPPPPRAAAADDDERKPEAKPTPPKPTPPKPAPPKPAPRPTIAALDPAPAAVIPPLVPPPVDIADVVNEFDRRTARRAQQAATQFANLRAISEQQLANLQAADHQDDLLLEPYFTARVAAATAAARTPPTRARGGGNRHSDRHSLSSSFVTYRGAGEPTETLPSVVETQQDHSPSSMEEEEEDAVNGMGNLHVDSPAGVMSIDRPPQENNIDSPSSADTLTV